MPFETMSDTAVTTIAGRLVVAWMSDCYPPRYSSCMHDTVIKIIAVGLFIAWIIGPIVILRYWFVDLRKRSEEIEDWFLLPQQRHRSRSAPSKPPTVPTDVVSSSPASMGHGPRIVGCAA